MTEAAAERIARLERSLGDPVDPLNPLGFAAVAAADERREPVSGAAPLLEEVGTGAELVPTELGGRLGDVGDLIEMMQALARRDPSLALAHLGMPLVGAVALWTRGRDEQRRAGAELLLTGGRLTAAFDWGRVSHQLPRLDLGRATSGPDSAPTLTGRCDLVADGDRADALLMPVRVDSGTRGRAREWLLVDLAGAPPGTVEHLPRVTTVGLTGVRFAGVEFHGLRLAADSLLDSEREHDGSGEDAATGTGATVLRTALPAIALGGLDTALRLTFDHLRSRRLYGAAASDLPAIRSLLTRTFVDLIVCDCIAMTAARMISRLPAQAELYSLASFCLAADVVPAAMHRLSVGLGARFYMRDGSSGMFQKLLRDLKPLALDGARTAAAGLALVSRTSFSGALGDTVQEALADAAVEPDLRDLTALLERLEHERRELALKPNRLIRLFAAAACAGTWLHHRDTDGFLGAPTWLRGALEALLEPGGVGDAPISPDVEATLYTELSRRCEQGRGLGLAARQLAYSR